MSGKEEVQVLIVEDDPDANELVSIILREEGYGTRSVFTGEDALAAIEIEKPDVILMDITLPKMDGTEVCRLLSNDDKTRSIPVIMLTARKELSTKLYSFVAGAKRYINKPFTSEELVTEIKRILVQKSQSSAVSFVPDFDPRD